ncbi:MAG: hypothetical protein AAGG50_11650 [Bacteroidota bacterium]
MLSSRAILLIGALSVALLVALAMLAVQLTTAPPTPATATATAYAPDYLTLVDDLDAYPLNEATARFLDAVQQQYPTPESPTIDETLAPAAVALAERLSAAQEPLDLVITAPSASVARTRADLLHALLESAGLPSDLLRIESTAGPAALVRRASVPADTQPVS